MSYNNETTTIRKISSRRESINPHTLSADVYLRCIVDLCGRSIFINQKVIFILQLTISPEPQGLRTPNHFHWKAYQTEIIIDSSYVICGRLLVPRRRFLWKEHYNNNKEYKGSLWPATAFEPQGLRTQDHVHWKAYQTEIIIDSKYVIYGRLLVPQRRFSSTISLWQKQEPWMTSMVVPTMQSL